MRWRTAMPGTAGGSSASSVPDVPARTFRPWRAPGRLDETRKLHLAMHGDSALSDNPADAALYFADRSLDAVELAQLPIGAELVVLSACYSADRVLRARRLFGTPMETADVFAGDDRFGLTAAVFAAGGQMVLSTLWQLDERYAATVLAAFQQGYLAGLPVDVALQQAILPEGVDAARPLHCVGATRSRHRPHAAGYRGLRGLRPEHRPWAAASSDDERVHCVSSR
jgi:hypothetical protein